MTTGRNTEELVRLIDALQITDKHSVATPANWKPGEEVIVPPPRTMEETGERTRNGSECAEWYFRKKTL